MSKNVAMFVDVANIYYAARGQEVDVDYVAMLKHATKGRDLIRAYAYSGLDPENENQRKFIDFLNKNGYKVLTKDIRKFGDGRVKANLDIELVVDLFRLADRMDIAVIVSGDGDFAPAIKALQDKGVRCEVISFKPNTSSDLIAVADEFIDIQKIAGIGRKKGEGSRAESMAMSMPEMPAKEVVPEFGFRDASPSVAAAALAALKGGTGRGNGRGGTRRRQEAAPEPAEAGTASASVAETDEAKRRRRRRGGRGRGRGRREETTATEPAVSADEPWEELDDLAALEGLGEEREYSFSEADPETLRELGLLEAGEPVSTIPEEAAGAETATPVEVVAEAPATEAAPARPRGRRRTSRTTETPASEADADADTGAAPSPAAEEKPKRTRTRTRRAAAGDEPSTAVEAEPVTDSDAEAKPVVRRRTRTRAAGAAAAPEAAPGEPASAPEEAPRRRTPRRRTTAGAEDGPSSGRDASAGADTSATAGDEDAGRQPNEDAGRQPNEDAGRQPQGIWGRFRSARGDRG